MAEAQRRLEENCLRRFRLREQQALAQGDSAARQQELELEGSEQGAALLAEQLRLEIIQLGGDPAV